MSSVYEAAFSRLVALPAGRQNDTLIAYFTELLVLAGVDVDEATLATAIGGLVVVVRAHEGLSAHRHTARLVQRYADALALLEHHPSRLCGLALSFAGHITDRGGQGDVWSATLRWTLDAWGDAGLAEAASEMAESIGLDS